MHESQVLCKCSNAKSASEKKKKQIWSNPSRMFDVYCALCPHHWTLRLPPQTRTNVKRGRTPALTAATTRRAPSSACATPPTSWGLMGNSATVSPNLPNSVLKSPPPRLKCLTVCKWRSLSPWRRVSGIEMEIVNSCENNNGGCSHHCQHSTSGPVCSCNQGYQLDHDLRTCVGKETELRWAARRRNALSHPQLCERMSLCRSMWQHIGQMNWLF